jgi:DNA-binding NtrC family response regulator
MSGSETALIVDDEEQLLRLMERVIQRAGFRTLTASDGDEALRIFRASAAEIDLVLLDVILSPGDGAAELLPKLLGERPELRVILTSGDALPEELEAKLAAIGGQFLRKPFAVKALVRVVQGDPIGTAAAHRARSTPGRGSSR